MERRRRLAVHPVPYGRCVVQDLGYVSTFPLLLNISGEPTYFIPLKDNTNLVKSYAMVNVAQYQIVATGGSAPFIVKFCRNKILYDKTLLMKGLWAIYQRNQ